MTTPSLLAACTHVHAGILQAAEKEGGVRSTKFVSF